MGIIGACMVPHPPLIIPAVGRGQEAKIMQTVQAYRQVADEIEKLHPDTIVIISPHTVMYADYFHVSPGSRAQGDFREYGAAQTRINAVYDTQFVDTLCELAQADGFMAGKQGEKDRHLDHATMIPLYFVRRVVQNFRIVRVGLSGRSLEDHYQLGQYIRGTAEKLYRRTYVIASGDLSHRLKENGPYGFRSEGPTYDARIMKVMGEADFLSLFDFAADFLECAGECGHRAFTVLAGALDSTGVEAKALSYEGPYGVGYGVCSYQITEPDPDRDFLAQWQREKQQRLQKKRETEDLYVQLARKALETYITDHEILRVPEDLPEEMTVRQAGVFVSLKKDGGLRGCIGTIRATQDCIAKEIIHNAISAGAKDPRFDEVRAEELPELIYSVDVLGRTEPVTSTDELDAQRYGVVVSKGFRRGLLLPNLEGVDTVERQIEVAREKAGIGRQEDVDLERFEVIRHI